MTPRRQKTEADYPLTIESNCLFCGQLVVSHRTGTGQPWRGGLDYWYTNDHHKTCPNDAERRAACAITDRLNKFMRGEK